MHRIGACLKLLLLLPGLSLPSFTGALPLFRLWYLPLLLATAVTFAVPANADTHHDDDDATVRFDGNWQVISSPEAWGGTVRASNVAGASVTVTFTGRVIAWYGYRCACAAGIARVYIDGELDATVDTYAATPEANAVIYRNSGLADGTHTLTIEVTGERHAAGNSAHVVIDRFLSEFAQMVQEDDFAIDYTGTWTPVSEPNASGGGGVISRTAGSTATITFTGTGIDWLGYRCACAAGIARVLLDGQLVATVNGNLPDPNDREAQAFMYAVQDLPMQQHTLRIEVTGASAAQSAWVALDAFRVQGGPRAPEPSIPLTSIEAPIPWALVTGNVTFRAYGQDDLYTTKMQFFANGNLIGEDLTRPYSITRDTSGIPDGSRFWLTTRVFDSDGNSATSPGRWVTVKHTEPERIPPTLSVTSPVPGSTVSGTIEIVPNASDASDVAWVGYAVDTQNNPTIPQGVSQTAPFVLSLDTRTLFDGHHNLLVKAMDFMRNGSAIITLPIVVDNRIQPGMVRVDEEDPAIVYDSGWSLSVNSQNFPATTFHWGDYAAASAPGSRATFTFDGVGVRLIGFGCDMCGDALVSIDGGTPVQVGPKGDEWGRPGNVARVVYTSPVLANGRHTITITVIDANTTNPNEYPFVIDGFEVLK